MAEKLLFICSRNQWRSPTAEALFRGSEDYQARSAGTQPSARVRVSASLLEWADWIFVMEKQHKEKLRQQFPELAYNKQIIVLDIPDEYGFMDEELVKMLRWSLMPYLQLPTAE